MYHICLYGALDGSKWVNHSQYMSPEALDFGKESLGDIRFPGTGIKFRIQTKSDSWGLSYHIMLIPLSSSKDEQAFAQASCDNF